MDQETILSCHRIILDTVDGMSLSCAVPEADLDFWPIVKAIYSKHAYTSGTGLRDALWQTVVGKRREYGNLCSIMSEILERVLSVLGSTPPDSPIASMFTRLEKFLSDIRDMTICGTNLFSLFNMDCVDGSSSQPLSEAEIHEICKDYKF